MTTQNIQRPGTAPPAAKVPGGRRGRRDFIGSSLLTPYLFLAPYLVLFFVFVLGPAIFGVYISLFEWDYMLPNKPFVGLENYAELFNPNSLAFENFWQSMEATAKFTLYSVPPLVLIPLAIALILNERFAGRSLFRAIYFAPFVLGIAVVGLLGLFMFDPNIGVVNNYLRQLGLPNFPWTTDLPWAWVTLVAVTVWWTLGFNAVIYLAGLQDISPELYDAAKVDGANRWYRFLYVTLPGLRPILLFVVTITILASANMFGQSYLITEGRPGNETRTAIMYIANEGLQQFKMGNAAAMSYFLALLLAIISVLNFVFFRQREE
jgi:multiple sugar transport system permease protein